MHSIYLHIHLNDALIMVDGDLMFANSVLLQSIYNFLLLSKEQTEYKGALNHIQSRLHYMCMCQAKNAGCSSHNGHRCH